MSYELFANLMRINGAYMSILTEIAFLLAMMYYRYVRHCEEPSNLCTKTIILA